MISFILRCATDNVVIGGVVLAVLALVGTLRGGGPYGRVKRKLSGAMPEVRWRGYSQDELSGVLREIGEEGRADYRKAQAWDVAIPLLFGGMLVLVTAWLVQGAGAAETGLRWLVALPLIYVVADLLEDVALAKAIDAFPDPGPLPASPLTQAKIAGLWISVLGLLAAAIARIAPVAGGGAR